MVDITTATIKLIKGNVFHTYHRETVVPRRFLRRNLRAILDSHERLLRRYSKTGDHDPFEDMIANERRVSGWEFPTRDMLKEIMNGGKPVLQIEALQVRHPGSRATLKKQAQSQSSDEDGTDWLTDARGDSNWPCVIGVAVIDTRGGTSPSKQRVQLETRPARILKVSHAGHPHFDVRLDTPFLIEVEKLFVVTDSSTNGEKRWKRAIASKYALEITIQCQDSDDSAQYLSQLENRDLSIYRDAPPNEGVLKATWESLPTCPFRGQLIPLKRAKGHKLIDLEYRVEVAMRWNKRPETCLERYNRISYQSQQPSRSQLPTPSASDDLDKAAKDYSIDWAFQEANDFRKLTMKGFKCAICSWTRAESEDHRSLQRLQLHCGTWHTNFKFEKETEEDLPDSLVNQVTLWISPVEPQNDRANKLDEAERMNWIAPNRPFNVGAEVRGEDNWTGTTRTKTAKSRNRPSQKDHALPVVPQRIGKRPAPEEVEDLPEHRSKKHRVPNVPGVSFYHTISKKLLKPGEDIAESDDDIDDFWLAQSQSRALEDIGIVGASKDFTSAFNKHLAREQSDSSILTRDAVVRFARLYRAELQDVGFQRVFRAKLNQLRNNGVINDEVVAYCISTLRAENTNESDKSAAGTPKPIANDIEREQGEIRPLQQLVNGEDARRPATAGSTTHSLSARSTPAANGCQSAPGRKKWDGGTFTTQSTTLAEGDISAQRKDADNASISAALSDASNKASHNLGCICGKSAKYARGGIACADPRCARKDFHLVCVGLERRVHAWRCRDCSA